MLSGHSEQLWFFIDYNPVFLSITEVIFEWHVANNANNDNAVHKKVRHNADKHSCLDIVLACETFLSNFGSGPECIVQSVKRKFPKS